MHLPAGFFGTRADILMDIVVVGVVITPFLMLYAFHLARKKKFVAHRNMLTGLLIFLLITVVLFEIDIRLSGGAKAFLEGSSLAETTFMQWFLCIHIAIAVTSFLGWSVLAISSWKAYLKNLPGEFSTSHRRYGKMVFAGVVCTAVTGVALYFMGFVL